MVASMKMPGVHHYDELLAAGISRHRMTALVDAGLLVRCARGWYAEPSAGQDVIRALRAGTRIGCLSACRLHGVWTPAHVGLHVAITTRAALPVGDLLAVHRLPTAGWPGRDPVLDLPHCIPQVLRHHGAEAGLMVLESAVNKGLLSYGQALEIMASFTRRRYALLRHFDPRAESGTETRIRVDLQKKGICVRTQVQITGIGRVDMLVDDAWIIEADSRAHHTGVLSYEADRGRDLPAGAGGFFTSRLTHHQTFGDWRHTRQCLSAIYATGVSKRRISPEIEVWQPELGVVRLHKRCA